MPDLSCGSLRPHNPHDWIGQDTEIYTCPGTASVARVAQLATCSVPVDAVDHQEPCGQERPCPDHDQPGTTLTVPDSPKMLRETLCVAQSAMLRELAPGDYDQAIRHSARLRRLIGECDRHRPLGSDGKHGDRHTATCGCDRGGATEPKRSKGLAAVQWLAGERDRLKADVDRLRGTLQRLVTAISAEPGTVNVAQPYEDARRLLAALDDDPAVPPGIPDDPELAQTLYTADLYDGLPEAEDGTDG